MNRENGVCLYCDKPLTKGRADKKFCDEGHRNMYHNEQKAKEHAEIKKIDSILKKNRRILKQLLGDKSEEIVTQVKLQKAGFDFDFSTHSIISQLKKNKFIFCYNYGFCEMESGKCKVIKSFYKDGAPFH
jgi:hypothetical protein